jgi:mannose-6-phosphate isomerase-like protein (cupin superfamily)
MWAMKTLTVTRPWGQFDQFTHNETTTVKIITVRPSESLSLQSHTKRSEFWRILNGSGVVEIENKKYDAMVGSEYNVPVNTKHRAIAGEAGLVFLEIDEGDFDEYDEIRYEDKYGRA